MRIHPLAAARRRDPGPVLVVEDDADSRHFLTTVLEFEGKSVVAARNGREGVLLARRHRPSLIVLDLMMPGMSGEEFRAAQVADPLIREIPVLVISAHHDAERIATRMKAAGYLPKPLSLEALTDFVHALAPQ